MARSQSEANLSSLGNFIRERRRALRLTQTELAERMGFTQERISLLENGKYGIPSLPSLVMLAQVLEVPFSAVLEAAGYSEKRAGQQAPGRVSAPPVAPAENMDDNLVAIRYLSRESNRLALGLEDLQVRLSMTEAQLSDVDRLRGDLQRRREDVRALTTALLTAALSERARPAGR